MKLNLSGFFCVSSNCGLLTCCIAYSALFLAVYRLVTTCWMLGDMTTDSLTTYEYYRFWKNFSENLATANISENITFYTNSTTGGQKDVFFVASYPWFFFFAAVAIWMLTPLVYTNNMAIRLFILLFYWEKFKKDDHDGIYNKLMIGFLRIFNLTPEEVNSYPTSLKVVIVMPPLGIILFITLIFYSAFLAYVQFPLFAIKIALEDLYRTSSVGCKAKIDQVFRRNKTTSKMISKAKPFCGLGIFDEYSIVVLKANEAFFESVFQFILSIVFFLYTRKYDIEGNLLLVKIFIPDNAILLSSMFMSMVTIMIAIIGWSINFAKLNLGKDFYKNRFSMSVLFIFVILSRNLLFIVALLFFFIVLFIM